MKTDKWKRKSTKEWVAVLLFPFGINIFKPQSCIITLQWAASPPVHSLSVSVPSPRVPSAVSSRVYPIAVSPRIDEGWGTGNLAFEAGALQPKVRTQLLSRALVPHDSDVDACLFLARYSTENRQTRAGSFNS